MVLKENVELWDLRVNLVDLVQWVLLVLWVPGECQEKEDAQVQVAQRVHVVVKETWENQARWVLWELMVPQVILDLQA